MLAKAADASVRQSMVRCIAAVDAACKGSHVQKGVQHMHAQTAPVDAMLS